MKKDLLKELLSNNLPSFIIDVDCVEDLKLMLETLEFVECVLEDMLVKG